MMNDLDALKTFMTSNLLETSIKTKALAMSNYGPFLVIGTDEGDCHIFDYTTQNEQKLMKFHSTVYTH